MPGPDQTRPIETAGNRPEAASLRCARCGEEFHCGMTDAHRPCWCAAYPRLLPVPQKEAGCYCPACLGELTADSIAGAARS